MSKKYQSSLGQDSERHFNVLNQAIADVYEKFLRKGLNAGKGIVDLRRYLFGLYKFLLTVENLELQRHIGDKRHLPSSLSYMPIEQQEKELARLEGIINQIPSMLYTRRVKVGKHGVLNVFFKQQGMSLRADIRDAATQYKGIWQALDCVKECLGSIDQRRYLGICRRETCGRLYRKRRRDQLYCCENHANAARVERHHESQAKVKKAIAKRTRRKKARILSAIISFSV